MFAMVDGITSTVPLDLKTTIIMKINFQYSSQDAYITQ